MRTKEKKITLGKIFVSGTSVEIKYVKDILLETFREPVRNIEDNAIGTLPGYKRGFPSGRRKYRSREGSDYN